MSENGNEPEYGDRVYWIWLQTVLSCGSHRTNALLSRFDSPREIHAMSPQELRDSRCFTQEEITKIGRCKLENAAAVACRCDEIGCRVLTPQDDEYPERLRNIYAMPIVLYIRGSLAGIDGQLVITMVGTRKCTDYGIRVGEMLGKQLADYGAAVLSGCATGIDTACLHGAIRRRGRVIGIIGSGLDVPYPAANKKMLQWLGDEQVLLSEFPPGMQPLAANFPIRNRILAALGVGTVVIEAGRGSGALITANFALEQGKDIFAVPGRIDEEQASGVLDLIRQGAKPVCGAEDILCEYERLFPNQLSRLEEIRREIHKNPAVQEEIPPVLEENVSLLGVPEELSEEQAKIFCCLSKKPVTAQAISVHTHLPVNRLLPGLTELEIGGYAVSCPGGRYALALSEPGG